MEQTKTSEQAAQLAWNLFTEFPPEKSLEMYLELSRCIISNIKNPDEVLSPQWRHALSLIDMVHVLGKQYLVLQVKESKTKALKS